MWAHVVDGPAASVVEDCLAAAFEDLIRSSWTDASTEPPAESPQPVAVAVAVASRGETCAHAIPAGKDFITAPLDSVPSDTAPSLSSESAADLSGAIPAWLLAQLDQVEALVEAIMSVDPATVSGLVAAEVSRRIHAVVGRLEAQRLGCIARIETEGTWREETMHSFPSWLAKAEGLSDRLAARTVAAARAVAEHLPATGVAARAGTITGEHVAIMVKATKTPVLREALATPVPGDDSATGDSPAIGDVPVCTGEEYLLGTAGMWRVEKFNQLVKSFTVTADPEAQDKAFKDATEREFLQISPTLGGMQINGFVTTEHGQLITTALRAVAGVPAAGALCPADLRKVDALVDLSQRFLDGGVVGKGANVRPHLSVHVSWEEFTRVYEATHHDARTDADSVDTIGAGSPATTGSRSWSPATLEARLRAGYATWEDGTGPIPDAVLRRIACDGEVTRIIFGPDSQILNISRSKRTFTKEHRRAIVARDRTCVWPGCDAPPHVCEIHHAIRHWADGGQTTPSNGVLLCRHHHHRVDGENIAMTYTDSWHLDAPGSYQA